MNKVKIGVVVFPGSNCDHDAFTVAASLKTPEAETDVQFLWHKNASLESSDIIILPGGFSFGDYLRTGAIARFSPVMNEVIRFANAGGTVIGICNGFQILLESHLLPGGMLRNRDRRFASKFVHLRVENNDTIFTQGYAAEQVLKIPIAHGEGNYFAEEKILDELQSNRLILFKYCTPSGSITDESNPNGSLLNIAGIMNKQGNVMGMMPHPERASESLLGSNDGRQVFLSLVKNAVLQKA
jgi:phosphoribosylformylglycinamidine synthase I